MNKKKKKIKIQNIAVLFENIEYGGATTHLINLINSSNYKFVKFCIITNKDNKAINNILSSIPLLPFLYTIPENTTHSTL